MASDERTSITIQDWFGLGIRLFALYSFFYAVVYLIDFAAVRMGWDKRPESSLLYAMGYAAFGLIVLSNAKGITRLTYWTEQANDESELDQQDQ